MAGPAAMPIDAEVLPRRRLRWHAGFAIGAAILAMFVLVAVFAEFLAPHDPYSQSLMRRLKPPVWDTGRPWVSPLGTGAFGRDYLSRLIYGTRISLAVGLGAAAVAGLIGAPPGTVAGFTRGRGDRVVA